MTNFDLSTEKLKPDEISEEIQKHGTHFIGGMGAALNEAGLNVAQAQIEKSRAYHAQQTGDKDLEQKIRDILCDDEQEHFTNEYYEEMKVGSGVWYITKVERLSTLLSQELKKRDEKKDEEWAAFIRSKVDRHYTFSKGSTGIHSVHEYDLAARLKEN